MNDSPLQITPIVPARRLFAALFLFSMLLGLTGCSYFHPLAPPAYVYVTVKRIYLRDRVAVVANRVAEVTNGERLIVVEHGRRFLKVKTPQGAVGWIEDHAVIDQGQFDEFQNLAKQHASEMPVTDALLYNELYMHLTPGRKTQHFYLLSPNAKVSLLERASVPRNASGVLGLPAASRAQWRQRQIAKLTSEALNRGLHLPSPWRTGGWCAIALDILAGCCPTIWR